MSEKFFSAECQTQLRELATAINKAKEIDPSNIDVLTQRFMDVGLSGKKPNVLQMYNEYTINAMLSGTGTPMVNFVSNAGQVVLRPLVELVKGVVTLNPHTIRQSTAMISAMFDGAVSDMKFFNRAMKTGMPYDYEISAKALGMSQRDFDDLLTEANIPRNPLTGEVDQKIAAQILNESYDYMTKAIPGRFGKVIRIPTHATVAIDEYFKARLRSQKALSLLSEKASKDAANGIGTYDDLYKQYKRVWSEGDKEDYASLLERVFGPDSTAIYDVRNYARDNTFQTELPKFLKDVTTALKGGGETPLQTLFIQALPFIRTPWNLATQGASYLPIIGYFARPLETKTILKSIAEDGQRLFTTESVRMSREDAVARQIVGFGIAATAMSMVDQGILTGSYPLDPKQRQAMIEAGIPEFSVKVGDQWVSYQKMEPVATVIGMAADIMELEKYAQREGLTGDKYYEEARKTLWQAFKANLLQKTFMEGFMDIAGVFDSTDPKGLERFAKNIGTRVIPAASATLAKALDPYDREANTFLERIKARVPGEYGRESLPIKYKAYGEPEALPAVGDVTGFKVYPLANEYQKFLGEYGIGLARPSRKIKGIELSNEQYGRLNAHINEMTTRYIEGLDLEGVRQNPNKKIVRKAIENTMTKIRTAARDRLAAEYPELRQAILDEKRFELGVQ